VVDTARLDATGIAPIRRIVGVSKAVERLATDDDSKVTHAAGSQQHLAPTVRASSHRSMLSAHFDSCLSELTLSASVTDSEASTSLGD